MKKAIARRHQIQKLERQLAFLEQLEQLPSAQVSGGKTQRSSPLTSGERTIIRQLQTQLNPVMKELAELKALSWDEGKAYAFLGVKLFLETLSWLPTKFKPVPLPSIRRTILL